MRVSKKTIVLAICFCIITFKVMASSIFVQSAIERACLQSHACVDTSSVNQLVISNEAASEEEPVHTLFLMSHVTGNLGNFSLNLPFSSESRSKYSASNDKLILGNISDCPFKPTKS